MNKEHAYTHQHFSSHDDGIFMVERKNKFLFWFALSCFFAIYCVYSVEDYLLGYILNSRKWHILWSYDDLFLFVAQSCTQTPITGEHYT